MTHSFSPRAHSMKIAHSTKMVVGVTDIYRKQKRLIICIQLAMPTNMSNLHLPHDGEQRFRHYYAHTNRFVIKAGPFFFTMFSCISDCLKPTKHSHKNVIIHKRYLIPSVYTRDYHLNSYITSPFAHQHMLVDRRFLLLSNQRG